MKIDKKKIKIEIIKFLKKRNPILLKLKKIPEDKSLLKLGYLDSFGLIELIEFIQQKFKVKINNNELKPEVFSTLNKMSIWIEKKLNKKL